MGALANEHKHTEMGTFPLKYGFALLDKVSVVVVVVVSKWPAN